MSIYFSINVLGILSGVILIGVGIIVSKLDEIIDKLDEVNR